MKTTIQDSKRVDDKATSVKFYVQRRAGGGCFIGIDGKFKPRMVADGSRIIGHLVDLLNASVDLLSESECYCDAEQSDQECSVCVGRNALDGLLAEGGRDEDCTCESVGCISTHHRLCRTHCAWKCVARSGKHNRRG